MLWKRSFPVLHKLVNVLLHVLEDKVKVVVNTNNLFQFYNLSVVKFPQGFNFSQRHALLPRVKFFFHLLDGNFFLGLDVDGLDYGPVGAISEGLQYFVFVHI